MLNQRQVARVFHALGDPTRRALVERLSLGPASVGMLAEPLGMTLAAVLQHVHILEESGVVTSAKAGRVRTCRLEARGLAVAEHWLNERRASWERRFDRLGALLAEEEAPAANRKKGKS